ncbi:hypothetical protein BC628DRAFT_1413377 [Trametes gibbosa]|uniref:Zn(2)-Cys(6)7 n=1 Tax=Trametes gibbosa TaxID=160864 RepID=A0A976SH66_9APHY|nr:hypothetical protein BC628DRAFT_1413377 [Trametes gibbosa]UVB64065.1 Zn(2)-Cys(6)7 [Trametes gibbosa]
MSTESATAKKRASAVSPKRTSEDDHRRKRRNRPTQSCLNCHTSKRMCDRQRPCGRCTQLGLTGLCVYEVDNPSHRANVQDEAARLQKRVAELESIIRELKNKPHPRWAQPGTTTGGGSPTMHPLADESGAGSSSSTAGHSPGYFALPPRSPAHARSRTPASPSALLEASSGPSAGPSVFGPPSPLNTPSPVAHSPTDPFPGPGADAISSMLNSDYDLSSLLASCHAPVHGGANEGYLNDMFETLLTTPDPCPAGHSPEEHCGCLNDHASYSTVLELSLRLRRAVEVLSRYAKHGAQSDCRVHRGISELDRFTTTALGNILTPPEPASSQPRTPPLPAPGAFGRAAYTGERHPQNAPAAALAPGALQSPRAWDFKSYPSPPWDDSFMSWEPLRQPSEWSQGAGL